MRVSFTPELFRIIERASEKLSQEAMARSEVFERAGRARAEKMRRIRQCTSADIRRAYRAAQRAGLLLQRSREQYHTNNLGGFMLSADGQVIDGVDYDLSAIDAIAPFLLTSGAEIWHLVAVHRGNG